MPWPTGYPKTLSPEQRTQRARNAANARASTDGLIKALSRKTLTAEQHAQLAALLMEQHDQSSLTGVVQ